MRSTTSARHSDGGQHLGREVGVAAVAVGVVRVVGRDRRRPDVVAAPPDEHLLLAVLLGRLGLVPAGEVAVVALVEPPVPPHRQPRRDPSRRARGWRCGSPGSAARCARRRARSRRRPSARRPGGPAPRPAGLRSTSHHPVKRFSAFQVLSPWRSRTSVGIAPRIGAASQTPPNLRRRTHGRTGPAEQVGRYRPSSSRRVRGMSARPSACGPDAEHLVDARAALLEVHRGRRHVEQPHPGPARADEADRLVPARLEVGDPGPQGERVVLAERLDVAHLEPGRLHRRHRLAHLHELAVGEDVPADEGAVVDRRRPGRAGDGVVQQPAAGPHERVRCGAMYSAVRASPTCSNMPMLLTASNGPSSTAR